MNSEALLRDHARLLDANLNRCQEGLRTLEDISRFLLNAEGMSAAFKGFRHRVAEAAVCWPRVSLLSGRDVEHDVGVGLKFEREQQRTDVPQIAAAAANRSQQSLRVLSEFAKQVNATSAHLFEQLRYQLYTAAAQLETQLVRRTRLSDAQLYVLVRAAETNAAMADHIGRLAEAGADVIQLREKECDDQLLYQRALAAGKQAQESGVLLIINDRPDIAVATEASGVHVGQTELPDLAARKVVGSQMLVGLSTHSYEQALTAEAQGSVDYLGCGPTFSSSTKSFSQFPGLAFLRQISDNISIPAFAIGGIDLHNVAEVLQSGCTRIAVSGCVARAADPYAMVRQLRQRVDDGRGND